MYVFCLPDIDECKINVCHHSASCTNTQGSYNCTCNPGYIGDGLNCEADPCHHYKNLSEANRKISAITNHSPTDLCDKELPDGWYRFVGAAGTKMPTEKETNYGCGATYSGRLKDAHPRVGNVVVPMTVCFDRFPDKCEKSKSISVKYCGSYYIYKLSKTSSCPYRYCGIN
ncbi:unnamed protein product [Pocillopora meandrina]|uniref:EGF-like domain-containing protein n=1 Tax=Pocillopora meandrina TaxID=46732 RepID=A0AAU9XX60_9CNID|nr:unnamed protein product [Pocillopora meandrina]